MRADWTVQREDGVALVTVRLAADPPRRVRVEHAGDGPLWPPREAGVPAAGWDDAGWTGVVDDRRALGFATPDAGDPPVRVEWDDPVEPEPAGFERHPDVPGTAPTAAGVRRAFGPTGPPRDAVPTPDAGREPSVGTDATAGAGDRTPSVGRVGRVRADGGGGSGGHTVAASANPGGDPDTGSASPGTTRRSSAASHDGFDAVERRVTAAESLAAAESLPELTDAVAAVGGLEGVYDLADRLEEDRARLRVTEERAGALRERLSGLEIPVERLERLA